MMFADLDASNKDHGELKQNEEVLENNCLILVNPLLCVVYLASPDSQLLRSH